MGFGPALRDRWLWAILAGALCLRLAVRWLAPHADFLGDEREYYSAAAVLADGRGFAFIDDTLWVRPPLYVLLLAGLFRVFGQGEAGMAQVRQGIATERATGAAQNVPYWCALLADVADRPGHPEEDRGGVEDHGEAVAVGPRGGR